MIIIRQLTHADVAMALDLRLRWLASEFDIATVDCRRTCLACRVSGQHASFRTCRDRGRAVRRLYFGILALACDDARQGRRN